jgi:Cellulase (glycosyl hydrolase family 5)
MVLTKTSSMVRCECGTPALCVLIRAVAVFVSLWAPTGLAAAAPLTASVDQHQGLPRLSVGGGSALSSAFVFWAKNWSWTELKTQFKVVAPFEYEISGIDQTLNFDLSAHITKPSNRQLVWTFDLAAAAATTEVIGGGISFNFDLANFGAQLGEPQLLPGNRGWSWGRSGGAQVEMRFDPPPAKVFFEPGRKSEVRAFFYDGVVPQGRQHFSATLTLSGDSLIIPTLAERFGLDDDSAWPTNILDWRAAPVDLSFLNAPERPAGKHGFLKTVNDKLIFEDGTPARFWGTNLTAYALFGTTNEDVRRQARRLSQLGFNLVRLHHMDSDWVQPNVFGKQTSDTQKLDEASLEKLDWWIKCLEDEGIYIWLDLHVGRQLKAGDQIEDFAEISKGKPAADLRGFNYVNASVQKAMQRFNEAYVNHLNHFTGLRYKDDPAVAAMLLTNENDVTHHFGNWLLPDKNVPHHDALYMAQATAFAEEYRLSRDKTWRSWEEGPSKLFLNDLEHKFNVKMIEQIRAMGAKSPIVTTSTWGVNPLSSLPSLTDGDIIDVHSYGGVGVLDANPLYASNLVDWIAAAQIVDQPLSVSEWNVEPFPVPDRHAVPLYVAGAADLQGWDALMQFAYSQQSLNSRGGAGSYEAFNDPALIATVPAAALLYRRHDAQEAHTTYVFAPTSEQLFNQFISPDNAIALRTAVEKGKLMLALPPVRELPWLKPSRIPADAKVITDPRQALIANDAGEVVSDTGELTRNWQQGIYKIDTARTQAAMGWIGGKTITLTDVEIEVTTRNATVAVQSLDNNPIRAANALMISLGARSIPDASRTTYHSEPVVGHLTIRAKQGLKFYRRDGDFQMETAIPASYSNGRYQIELGPNIRTYWLLMK